MLQVYSAVALSGLFPVSHVWPAGRLYSPQVGACMTSEPALVCLHQVGQLG